MNHRAKTSLMTALILGPVLSVLGAGVASAQDGAGASRLTNIQKRLLSGFASFALSPEFAAARALSLKDKQDFTGLGPAASPNYLPAPNGDCDPDRGSN